MSSANEDQKVLDEEEITTSCEFKGKLLELSVKTVRTASGHTARREVVHHPGGVVIAPILPQDRSHTEASLVLVKQYRQPVQKLLWELPAGTREQGESPRACARRELLEETGYKAEKLERKVDLFTSPGYSDEKLALFVATGLKQAKKQKCPAGPEDEDLRVGTFSLKEIKRKATNGEITDGKTLAGLFFL